METLKWSKPWGPKRWRADMQWLIDAINARTPLEGEGIQIDYTPNGAVISIEKET